MKTIEEQLAELLNRVEALEASPKQKSPRWVRVIEYAKNYAMLKSFGKYVERKNGYECFMVVTHSERPSMEKMFTENLLRECIAALADDAAD
jgi:hypothetical protein